MFTCRVMCKHQSFCPWVVTNWRSWRQKRIQFCPKCSRQRYLQNCWTKTGLSGSLPLQPSPAAAKRSWPMREREEPWLFKRLPPCCKLRVEGCSKVVIKGLTGLLRVLWLVSMLHPSLTSCLVSVCFPSLHLECSLVKQHIPNLKYYK